ncbi:MULTISPECIES: SDR family NAD(P)-dependent oxidoreductase [unclassified Burkholderia]|uniref:SDR family NAD(P)-dependent oxidoreductase n=1 Tax=unclassified Burkholderia TaxID=2613784 RepID=UPI00214FF732|nr:MULTISPECIES: SDR family NAD(P)-dependent oxidoreductase [unclassified Burkholderia]MCR4471828.1 SDR family NAD(P)-dependent oxidoreductase [Burkholderia sp. SCN-KJ]
MDFLTTMLKGKVALVTGGSTGIGRTIALELAEAGADVAITSRNNIALQETVASIGSLGVRALGVAADVSKKSEVDRMYESVIAELTKIDILVNCAGGSARERSSLFCDSTEEIWDEIIGRNYKGVLNVTHAVIGKMISQRAGRIINISSLDGVIGAAGRADYSGAKAAVIGFSSALAKEVAPHKITVNCISPGPIVSGYDEAMLSSNSSEAAKWARQMSAVTGFGYGSKTDISSMALFLASDGAGFISGQNFSICGLANMNPAW